MSPWPCFYYWVTYEGVSFLFFGAFFPPSYYKYLYFFLVALSVIPVAVDLLLLHHQDRSCYLVSSHAFVRKQPPAHLMTLSECFLTFPSPQTPGQLLSLAVTAAQPSTVKLEEMQLCSSWSKSSHLWAIKFLHSPTLWKWGQQNLQKHLSYLSFHRFLFFFLPVKNSNHSQRDLKQQIYFSRSAAWCQITYTIQKKSFQILVYWWVFYHNFSFLMPVFRLHRACHLPVFKALYGIFENLDGRQNSPLTETHFPQLFYHCSSENVHHPGDSTMG